MSISDLSLEVLRDIEQELPMICDNPYINVYDNLVRIASKLRKYKNEDSLIGVAHMAYGWMPTIIDFDTSSIDMVNFFQNAESGSIDTEFLNSLKLMVSNSIVGASKVLHFFFPDKYPIWDSNVYQVITKKFPYNYRVNEVRIYQQYVLKLRELTTRRKEVETLKENLISKGYCSQEATNIRVLELILFYSH